MPHLVDGRKQNMPTMNLTFEAKDLQHIQRQDNTHVKAPVTPSLRGVSESTGTDHGVVSVRP